MWKVFIAVIIVALFLTMSTPVTAYSLDILVTFDSGYNPIFSPSFYLNSVPRMTLIRGGPILTVRQQLSFFGVESVYLDVNATAWNINGTVFFDGRVTINSLAEQRIVFHREYQSELYTNNLTLQLDAYLFVDLENQTDIEREFHHQWSLVLP